MALVWCESGTDATQDLSFYATTSGTVSSATDQSVTGGRSVKLSTGSPAAAATAATPHGILADVGRRISVYWRTDTLSGLAASRNIAVIQDASGASSIGLGLNPSGNLYVQFFGTSGATAGVLGAGVSVNTWHRMTVSYVITGSRDYSVSVYVDGTLAGTVGSATVATTLVTNTSRLSLNQGAVIGANVNFWYDDIYIDDGTDLGDPGNIRVTAKRPNANGQTNSFDTTTSTTSSGYGTGNSVYVNERPLATTGARRHNAATSITVGTAASTSSNTTTSFTLTIPSDTTTDDILVLAAVNRDATADPTVTDNDTGGNTWTKLAAQNADTNGAISVWWKRATSGSASKTITASGFTGSSAGGVIWYRGAATGSTPFSGTTAVGEANASNNETQAEITVGDAGAEVFLVVGCTSNDTLDVSSQAATDPSSLTERFEGTSTGGSDCSIALASATKTTSGTTGAFTWAQTNGTGASLAFALRPKGVAETFAIEDAATGDVNVTGQRLIGRLSWVHASGVSTDGIYDNGSAAVPATAFTGTAGIRYLVADSGAYPTGTVGMDRPTHSATDAILNETGVLIAYRPPGRSPFAVHRPQFYSTRRR